MLHISNIVDNSLNFPSSSFKPSFLFFLCKISSVCISYILKSIIFHHILRSVWGWEQLAWLLICTEPKPFYALLAVWLLNSSISILVTNNLFRMQVERSKVSSFLLGLKNHYYAFCLCGLFFSLYSSIFIHFWPTTYTHNTTTTVFCTMNETSFLEISCQHSHLKHGLHFPSLCLNPLHGYYFFP